jgi:hypothetical protein
VNERCLRQYVELPVELSCDVLLIATNVGNIMSILGTSGVKTATTERPHTADIQNCAKTMYRVYVTKKIRSKHISLLSLLLHRAFKIFSKYHIPTIALLSIILV